MAVEERAASGAIADAQGRAAGVPLSQPSHRAPVAGESARRVLPLWIALLIIVLTYWTGDVVSPALPAMQQDLALSAAGAGLIFSLLFAGRLIGNFPAAFLLDRTGAVATATVGGALLTAGLLAATLAPSAVTLFLARVVQGVGVALLVNAGLRSILRAKPGQGAAMTYFLVAATVGGVFGLQSGGYLTEAIGWRAVFALGVGLSAAATGAALLSRAVRPDGAAATSTSAPGESAVSPPAPLRFLLAPLLLNFLAFVNYSLFVALPLYAERIFGASAETNANLLLVISVVHIVAAVPVGRAIRRWGAPRTVAAGLLLAAVGTALVLPAPGTAWIAGPMVLYGIGQVAATNASGDLVLQRGTRSIRAIRSLRLSSDLGLVLGPYAAGALADVLGYGAPFVALPVMSTLAAVAALRLRVPTAASGSA